MERKNLLLTFDYELFMGRDSGTVEKCMIEPTRVLLDILSKHKLQSIFFIDTTYLIRLKEVSQSNERAENDYRRIKDQIQRMVKNNHSVFIHIHPHWIDAKYSSSSNSWQMLDTSKFAFANLKTVEQASVFEHSIDILREIISPVKPEYQMDGFRAGGLYVQPFSIFKPLFKEHKIKYDFSVFKGFRSSMENYSYDFTIVPEEDIYKFEDSVTEKEIQGSFTEFAISSFELKNFKKLINSIWFRVFMKFLDTASWGDGLSSVNKITNKTKKTYWSSKESFSVELINPIKTQIYLEHLDKSSFCHFISHPKLFSPYNLKVFDLFISRILKKYNLETNFRKMCDAL